jgi:hypothetical protein
VRCKIPRHRSWIGAPSHGGEWRVKGLVRPTGRDTVKLARMHEPNETSVTSRSRAIRSGQCSTVPGRSCSGKNDGDLPRCLIAIAAATRKKADQHSCNRRPR